MPCMPCRFSASYFSRVALPAFLAPYIFSSRVDIFLVVAFHAFFLPGLHFSHHNVCFALAAFPACRARWAAGLVSDHPALSGTCQEPNADLVNVSAPPLCATPPTPSAPLHPSRELSSVGPFDRNQEAAVDSSVTPVATRASVGRLWIGPCWHSMCLPDRQIPLGRGARPPLWLLFFHRRYCRCCRPGERVSPHHPARREGSRRSRA